MHSARMTQIEPAELASLLWDRDSVLVVDLRSTAAYSQTHIPGAKHVPFERLAEWSTANLPLRRMIVLCSADGALAQRAWVVLAARGVLALVLKGGLRRWATEVKELNRRRISRSGLTVVVSNPSPRLKTSYEGNTERGKGTWVGSGDEPLSAS